MWDQGYESSQIPLFDHFSFLLLHTLFFNSENDVACALNLLWGRFEGSGEIFLGEWLRLQPFAGCNLVE
jgi:hypothetical protein